MKQTTYKWGSPPPYPTWVHVLILEGVIYEKDGVDYFVDFVNDGKHYPLKENTRLKFDFATDTLTINKKSFKIEWAQYKVYHDE